MEWERSKGKKWVGAAAERNEIGVDAGVFDCRVCGMVCKSKGGLVNHRRRIHEESEAKKTFKCERCAREFKKESEKKNHARVCGGAMASEVGKVRCVCGGEYEKKSFPKHRRNCARWQEQQGAASAAPAPAARGPCPDCGNIMRRDNIARHQRTACSGSVAGP